jgi:hypothetical protein
MAYCTITYPDGTTKPGNLSVKEIKKAINAKYDKEVTDFTTGLNKPLEKMTNEAIYKKYLIL